MKNRKPIRSLIMILAMMLIGCSVAQASSITQEEAITIAIRTVKDELNVDLENSTEYTLNECVKRDKKGSAEWFVLFAGEQNQRYATNTYAIYLKEDGSVRWVVPPTLINSLNEEFNAIIREKGAFVTWGYEEKYYFRNEWYVRVAEWEKQHHDREEEISGYLSYLLERPYALPSAEDITFETAEMIARDALALSEEQALEYKSAFSFLDDEEAGRTWTVYFIPRSHEVNLSPYYKPDRGYKVMIRANDGTVIDIVNQNDLPIYWTMYNE